MSALVDAMPLGAGTLTARERARERTLDLGFTLSRTWPDEPPSDVSRLVGEEEPGAPLGRYLLGPRLAVGGMGEVFVATQLGLGRFQKPLALKLLLPHLAADADAVEMFLDEAHVAARMSHPNVVQIFDVGLADGRYYIAMELVPGISMSSFIHGLTKDGRKLSANVLLYIARCLCDGLHHAHEQRGPDGRYLGVVHRDVTPHNVLLSNSGEVKLGDFGIAKFRNCTSHTRPGCVKGKMAYLSPEQAIGKKPDRRADIFSAAITLFHLATGECPFRRDDQGATLKAVQQVPLPDLGALRPDLPRELVNAIARAASKDPFERFPTAHAFREALPSIPLESADELASMVREMGERKRKPRSGRDDESGAVAAKPCERKASLLGPRNALLALGFLAALVALAALFSPGAQKAPRVPTLAVAAAGSAAAVAVTTATATTTSLPVEAAAPAAVIGSAPVAPLPTAPRRFRAPTGSGYVTIDARPWAQVSIAGQPLGDTPIHAYPLSPGYVTVTLRNPRNGKTEVRTLKVSSGKLASLEVDLR
jgi:eukaryotic-like serine/threonine-protein kinase